MACRLGLDDLRELDCDELSFINQTKKSLDLPINDDAGDARPILGLGSASTPGLGLVIVMIAFTRSR